MESTEGKGSTFHCRVEFGVKPRETATPASITLDLQRIRTLIVDDHPTNRQILTESLSGWNAQVTDVSNGPDALEALRREASSGQPYQLLLLDCRMPGMHGFQVVEEIQRSDLSKDLTVTYSYNPQVGREQILIVEYRIGSSGLEV